MNASSLQQRVQAPSSEIAALIFSMKKIVALVSPRLQTAVTVAPVRAAGTAATLAVAASAKLSSYIDVVVVLLLSLASSALLLLLSLHTCCFCHKKQQQQKQQQQRQQQHAGPVGAQ